MFLLAAKHTYLMAFLTISGSNSGRESFAYSHSICAIQLLVSCKFVGFIAEIRHPLCFKLCLDSAADSDSKTSMCADWALQNYLLHT